jgi:hypothetical protein
VLLLLMMCCDVVVACSLRVFSCSRCACVRAFVRSCVRVPCRYVELIFEIDVFDDVVCDLVCCCFLWYLVIDFDLHRLEHRRRGQAGDTHTHTLTHTFTHTHTTHTEDTHTETHTIGRFSQCVFPASFHERGWSARIRWRIPQEHPRG